jgi:NADPH:quinone reductase-like Zn-dependent oxidoreductase
MKAAVLHAFGEAPRYEDFPDPTPEKDEVIMQVKAASLTNVSKSRARGSHYDSHRQLPAVCGVDGMGILSDGTRVFGGGCRPPYGMMAERAAVPLHLPVPDGIDDVTAAALPNPALSSWLPLVWRAKLKPCETVLVLGATGVAGKLAIQIAKHLGAGRVVAAGRNESVLEGLGNLGADATIPLDRADKALFEAFVAEASNKSFDVILDYVWGHPAEVLLGALTGHDLEAEPSPIRYVSIGAMAGPTAAVPSETLRSSGLEIYGAGGGSIPRQAIFEVLPKMFSLAAGGGLHIDTEPVPLAEVEKAWRRQDTNGRRLVLVP